MSRRKAVAAENDAEHTRAFILEEWPFFWISKVVGLYQRQMETALKPIGLDIARWRVLMALWDNTPSSVSEIAEKALVKLPTMTKIVQRMQAEGLVTCGARETDARVTEVILTPSGKLARDRAWRIADRIYRRAFNRISAKETVTLNTLLRKLANELEY